MSEEGIAYRALLVAVAEELAKTSSVTDHLMLTKWRVLSVCQYLLGCPNRELEEGCRSALETFVNHGAGVACDKALETVRAMVKRAGGEAEPILPTISREKREAVCSYLDKLADAETATIERALQVLPAARERMSATSAVCLPGIRHRFQMVAAALEDLSRSTRDRARAGAAVLYVDEVADVIPDTLGVIGMVDDDYALRIVLEEIGGTRGAACLHWSEKISSLWDDLPFLQGVNLRRGDRPVSVTWLDRVNSYISYSHVLSADRSALVLLQPSVACSPLHPIVSLIGLLVLDAVTSSQSKAHALRVGQTYEIDGFVVRFEGVAGPPTPGWIRLRARDGVVYRPPGLADRMIPVEACRLSSARDLPSRSSAAPADPVQRFFDWDAAIGPGSISSRLALVTSRQRAIDLLDGVQSNGVRLLDHGLVRFVGAMPGVVETHGTVLLVLPSLGVARVLLDQGIPLQAILVDGYDRLYRGRHELGFLLNRRGAPSIISWSPTGYYPAVPPSWLPPHRRLEVSSDDLASILELDDASPDLGHSSLWEAATGVSVQSQSAPLSRDEAALVDALDTYIHAIRSSQSLPEYWQYYLTTLARTLRILVTATPAEWSSIRDFASAWSSSLDEKWSSLRPSAISALADLREAESRIRQLINNMPDGINSRAAGLVAFVTESPRTGDPRYFVCDRPEQTRVAAAFVRVHGLQAVEPVLLRELPVCSHCLVAGWVSSHFARRLWAHTPREIVALVDERDQLRWGRAANAHQHVRGQSLLHAVGGRQAASERVGPDSIPENPEQSAAERAEVGWGSDKRAPCVFLWLTGEPEAKVLARDGRVVVEEGDTVRERLAARLRPDDRVIIGLGMRRWSPAEEFTDAVVEAVQDSHPELVKRAKEWRRALRQLQDAERLSTTQVRSRLAAVGVERETQTIEGWLDMDRSSPIGPRGQEEELGALWPLVDAHVSCPLEEVAAACSRLRTLRAASGRALLQLWKGRTVELGVDETLLDDLVDRLRQTVQAYEVEAVTLGEVPTAMLGWWVTPALANHYESDSGPASFGRDDLEDADEELA